MDLVFILELFLRLFLAIRIPVQIVEHRFVSFRLFWLFVFSLFLVLLCKLLDLGHRLFAVGLLDGLHFLLSTLFYLHHRQILSFLFVLLPILVFGTAVFHLLILDVVRVYHFIGAWNGVEHLVEKI